MRSVCGQLIKVVSESSEIEGGRKKILTEKIRQILDRSLNPETAEAEKKRLHLEKIRQDELNNVKKAYVATSILRAITSDDTEEEVIFTCFIQRMHSHSQVQYGKESAALGERSAGRSLSSTFNTVDLEKLDARDVMNVFSNEVKSLCRKKGIKRDDEKKLQSFYNGIFLLALDQLEEEIEEGVVDFRNPVKRFFEIFPDLIDKHLSRKEAITKEDFRGFMGRELPGGRGSPLLDIDSPKVQELKRLYESGKWKEGEKKDLVPDVVSDQQAHMEFVSAVVQVMGNSKFSEMLNAYFKT